MDYRDKMGLLCWKFTDMEWTVVNKTPSSLTLKSTDGQA
jgi:hypothetical protein